MWEGVCVFVVKEKEKMTPYLIIRPLNRSHEQGVDQELGLQTD